MAQHSFIASEREKEKEREEGKEKRKKTRPRKGPFVYTKAMAE